MAAKEFIVGGVDTKWSTAGNWNPANAPATGDTVTINAAVTAMQVDVVSNVLGSFDATGAGAGFALSGSGIILMSGNFTMKSGGSSTMSNQITFTANGSYTFDPNGVSFAGCDIRSVMAADLTLAEDVTCENFYVYGAGSSLNTANHNITSSATFGDAGVSNAVTLTLGSSTINCSNVSFGSATLTVSDNTATINVACVVDTTMALNNVDWGGASFVVTYSPTGADNHAINFTGTSCVLGKLDINLATDRRDCSVAFNNNFTLENDSTWKAGGAGYDNPTIRLLIKSSAIGTARTCAMAANMDLAITDCDMQDITVTVSGTGAVAGTRVGDCGGNTGCDCDTPKTVYIDYGTANCNWSDAIWSTSSGGGSPSLNNFPLPQDTAVIDNSSWDDISNTVTVNVPRIGGITATDLTEGQTITWGVQHICYGDLLLNGNGLVINYSGGGISFDARVATTLTLNVSDDTDTGMVVTIDSYGGVVELASGFTDPTRTWTLTRGTLDLKGQTIICRTFNSSGAVARELKDTAGGGKIVVTGVTGTIFTIATETNLTVANAPDIQIGSGGQTQTGDVEVILSNSSASSFGDVLITHHKGDYYANFSSSVPIIKTLTLETPDSTDQYSQIKFGHSMFFYLEDIVAVGDPDYPIKLISSTDGEARTIACPWYSTPKIVDVHYCYIKDTNMVTPDLATWDASDGTNTNVSGNTGWTWYISGTTCWGHSTDVTETNTRTFTTHWLGTGTILGSGDLEELHLNNSEVMLSEMVNMGVGEAIEISWNKYQAGDTPTVSYRQDSTAELCAVAAWGSYTGTFTSLGYVQLKLEKGA